MLRRLFISNYALIDRLEIEFGEGFNVITGETGAGKSIIMGALALVMGERADKSAIKEGETKCIVEAVLTGAAVSEDAPDGEIIVRREIWSNGRSRAFVNDSPVQLSELRDVVEQLVDIHSQHQNLLLNKEDFQLKVVDAVSDSMELRTAYSEAYRRFRDAERELNEVTEQTKRAEEERDYLEFQYNQLSEANLHDGEQEELEEELEKLEHAEEIKGEMAEAIGRLEDEQYGVVASLKEALARLGKAGKYMSIPESEVVNDAYLNLREATADLNRRMNDLEVNPARKDQVSERLDTIYTLEQKHRVASIGELLALQTELGERLSVQVSMSVRMGELAEIKEAAFREMVEKGKILSEKRNGGKEMIGREMEERLRFLGIEGARFDVRIEEKEWCETGCDKVTFWFSGNEKVSMQPISKVASGGEIARVMLVIKRLMAEAIGLGTIIFDEVDTGVSGEMGKKMGTMMSEIGEWCQVVCITHLAQVAAQGRRHFKVFKTAELGTQIRELGDKERVDEIASIIAGAEISDAAREAARELLGK